MGLLEVVFALVVLLVVLVPATYLIDTTVQQTASAKEKVTATELAEQELERLANDSLTFLESGLNVANYDQSSASIAGVTYTTSALLSWEDDGTTHDLCSLGSPPQVITATATVSWGAGQAQKLAEESVINPPYALPIFNLASGLTSGTTYTSLTATSAQTIAGGSVLTIGAGTSQVQTVTTSADVNEGTTIPVQSFKANANYPGASGNFPGTAVALPNLGFLAVQVNGVTGSAPAHNINQITVTVTPSTGPATTYTPDNNGCVFEQELPGSYGVTLGSTSTPPFIDTTESTSPSPTACNPLTVTAEQISNCTWVFDQAADVTFSPSGSLAAPSNAPVSVYASGLTTANHWKTVLPLNSSTSYAYLYPFTQGYSGVWYGDCLAEEPSNPSTVSVTPGGSSSATISGLVPLLLQVKNSSTNAAMVGATVQGTVEDPNSSDSCPQDVLTLATSNSQGQSQTGLPEATRNDTGCSTTVNSPTVSDSAITAADVGREVTGTGIPANSYVGSVSGGTFKLMSAPVGGSAVNATVTGTATLTLMGDHYNVTVAAPSPDTHTTTIAIQISPGGVVYNSTFYPTGTAVPVGVA